MKKRTVPGIRIRISNEVDRNHFLWIVFNDIQFM